MTRVGKTAEPAAPGDGEKRAAPERQGVKAGKKGMTNIELGSLSLKLAGIYTLVQALPMLQVFSLLLTEFGRRPVAETHPDWGTLVAVELTPFFLMLLMGYLLIRYSAVLARNVFADPEAPATTLVNVADLRALALSVIGIAMVASALPRFTRFAFYLSARSDSVRSMFALTGDMGPELVERCAQLLIGLGLFFGQRGLADLWRKLRVLWLTLRGREKRDAEQA